VTQFRSKHVAQLGYIV